MVDRIKNGVRRLVRHHIGAQAGENETAGVIRSLGLMSRRKIPEEQRPLRRVVIRIRIAEGMGVDTQPLEILLVVGHLPDDPASQGPFKVADRFHHHRIDNLLVKLWIAFAGCQSLL